MADGSTFKPAPARELLTSAHPFDAALLGYEEGPTHEDHTQLIAYPGKYPTFLISHEGQSVELPEMIAEKFAREILAWVGARQSRAAA